MEKSNQLSHGSVKIRKGLRGGIRLKPRFVVDGQHWEGMSGSLLTTFALEDVANVLLVPVKQTTQGCLLEQVILEGWDRRLKLGSNLLARPVFFLPVILSARTAWHATDGKIELFDCGYVLDGACRLEAACRRGTPKLIPALVLFNLTSDEELRLRSQLVRSRAMVEIEELGDRIDTATQRLEINTRWVELTIESDPFVVPTFRGYTPAILVRRPRATQREHLLIGASSIAKPLEEIRKKYTTLKGQVVAVKKTGREKIAKYAVRVGG